MEKEPAFAIVRVDLEVEDDESRFTVTALSGIKTSLSPKSLV